MAKNWIKIYLTSLLVCFSDDLFAMSNLLAISSCMNSLSVSILTRIGIVKIFESLFKEYTAILGCAVA